MFATPILGGLVGPATQFVLDKLKGKECVRPMVFSWLKFSRKKSIGNASITAHGDVSIGQDLVGRDKYNIIISSQKETPDPPRMAPRVRRPFIGREKELRELKATLKLDEDSTTSPVIIALTGLPGVGKTTLAIELANDHQIEETFYDGILWTSLGPKPHVMSELDKWARRFGKDVSRLTSCEERMVNLASFLHTKKAPMLSSSCLGGCRWRLNWQGG